MKKIDRDVRPNQVGFDYPTMSNDELIELPVDEWAYDDCHLFLWTTHRFLPNAFELLKHWGFRYVDTWVWMKPGGFQPIGLPQYNCEFALLARRGKPIFVELTDFKLCFEAIGFKADRHQHSRKPDEFYNLVRRVTVGRRIDVFSREPREGFEQHGNEIDKFSSSETASSPAVGGAAVIRATLRMPGEAAGDQHDDAALCEPEPAVASVGAPSGEVRNV